MPLLDIGNAQPSLQRHLVLVRVQTLVRGRLLLNPWKSSKLLKRVSFHVGHLESSSGKLRIRAVATLEPKCVPKEDVHDDKEQFGGVSSPSSTQLESSRFEDLDEEPDEKEKLRWTRISKANKENTPWNKGRKHNAETLQRIRERTRKERERRKEKVK